MFTLYMQYPSWLHPEIFSIGSYSLRWYSLNFALAFVVTYMLAKTVHKKDPFLSEVQLSDVFMSGIMGLIIGARLFYVLFYKPDYYLANPLAIIWPFEGGEFVGIQGLSYHGGAVGALVGVAIYARVHRINLWQLADFWSMILPFGYTLGRLGNFANAELYGKATGGGFGMLFPDAQPFSTRLIWVRDMAREVGMGVSGSYINLPRHPSQLYEALFEGVLLGLFLLFVIRPRVTIHGQVFAFYLMGYGLTRFFIEYLREPDAHLGYVIALGEGANTPGLFVSFLNFSMGQMFSLAMTLLGLILFYIVARRHKVSKM